MVQDDRKRVFDCVILSLKYGEQPISGLVNQEKVDIQDKKVDIEQYLVLENENVNLKGISILTVCIPLII